FRSISKKKYNCIGKVIETTDIHGLKSKTHYDVFERPLEHHDINGNHTEYHYNDFLLTTTTYLNKHKTHEKRSEPWNLLEVDSYYPIFSNPYDFQMEYIEHTIRHSGFNKKIEETNAIVHRYNLTKRDAVTRVYQYDAKLNPTSEITYGYDDSTLTIDYAYDIFNNPVTKQKKLQSGKTLSASPGETLVFNQDGLLSEVQSAALDCGDKRITKYIYDNNGRKIKTILPSGKAIHQTYNPLGLADGSSWQVEGENYQVNYHYDADRRLISANDSQSQAFTFDYTANGLLKQMTYPDTSTYKATYDDKNRKLLETFPSGRSQSYHYKPEDKGKISEIHSRDLTVQYTYGSDDNDVKQQLVQRSFDHNQVGLSTETFIYGALGSLVKSTLLNQREGLVYEVNYQFTPRKQLASVSTHTHNGHIPVDSVSLSYTYNALNQLTSELAINAGSQRELYYRYDANGNLTREDEVTDSDTSTSFFTFNALDQLVKITSDYRPFSGELTYDLDGRLIKDHKGVEYTYDTKGRLLTGKAGDKTFQYAYWLTGQLKSRQPSAIECTNLPSIFYQNQEGSLVTMKEADAWHDLLRDNKSIFASTDNTGTESWVMLNHSVGAVVSKQGEISTQEHMAYGSPIRRNLSGLANVMSWHQAYKDTSLDLVFLGSRFYSPTLKRFIAPDTLLVDNRYRYGKSNPIYYFDPTGKNARDVNYGLGGGATALGIVGVIFALPTGGASLTLSGGAAVAAGVSTALSGASLIGSQAALDSGNKQVAKALQFTSIGLGIVALASTGVSLAPAVENFMTVGRFNVTANWYDHSIWHTLVKTLSKVNRNYDKAYIDFLNPETMLVPENRVTSSIASSSLSVTPSGSFLTGIVINPFEAANAFPDATVIPNAASSTLRSTSNGTGVESLISSSASSSMLSPVEVDVAPAPYYTSLPFDSPPRVHQVNILNWGEVKGFRRLTTPVQYLEDNVFTDEGNVLSY
ncbi:MAG: hypothetical protein OXE99_01315, partial [Cellvibrionales bacterium]|nr:hypothetical protein [Cellvibrionales bacterium]